MHLAVIAFGAFALRLGLAVWYDARTPVSGDATWYLGIARQIFGGPGFLEPLNLELYGRRIETAGHPPLYAVWLSLVDVTGDASTLVHRLWSGLAGAGTVVLLGLLGRDVADERTGRLAALVAAGFLELAVQDVILMSEGLFACTVVASVWLAVRYRARPTTARAGALGVAIAAAALTRAEAIALLGLLAAPVILLRTPLPRPRRLAALGVTVVAAAVAIAPWSIHNQGRFSEPVVLSTGLGRLLGSSNCPNTYWGPGLGGWGGNCARGIPTRPILDETVSDRVWTRAARRFIAEHPGRLVTVVMPVRVARSLSLWRPLDGPRGDLLTRALGAEWLAWAALAQYYVLAGAGVAGMVLLARRRRPCWPLLAPWVMVVLLSLGAYGTLRFRAAGTAVLPVPAAVGLGALLSRPGSPAPRVRTTR